MLRKKIPVILFVKDKRSTFMGHTNFRVLYLITEYSRRMAAFLKDLPARDKDNFSRLNLDTQHRFVVPIMLCGGDALFRDVV